MKKYVAFALVIVFALATGGLAATPKTAPAPATSPAPPVPASTIVGDAWSGKIAWGGLALGAPANCAGLSAGMGIPVVQYHFNKDMMGTLGLSYTTGNNVTNTDLLAKFDYTIGRVASVANNIGLMITTVSTSNLQSVTTIGGTWGFRTLVQSNMAISCDAILFGLMSQGGNSTTMILPGAVLAGTFYL